MEPRICHYCSEVATTRDHIVPRSLVRQLRLSDSHWFHEHNLVPACEPCNHWKDDQDSGCACAICEDAWRYYLTIKANRDERLDRSVVWSTGPTVSAPTIGDLLGQQEPPGP